MQGRLNLTELVEEETIDDIERTSPEDNLPFEDIIDDAGPRLSMSKHHMDTPPFSTVKSLEFDKNNFQVFLQRNLDLA